MASKSGSHKHFPAHIKNLIHDLSNGSEVLPTLSSYIPLLSSDISLYYIFLQFKYSPEHGNFLTPPNSADLISWLEKEYHSSLPDLEDLCSKLVIDVKKEFLSTFSQNNLHSFADPADLDLVESRNQSISEYENDLESVPHTKFSLGSEMNTPRINKGLKVLSKKIKDILIQKGKISYKEMANIVVTDMENEIDREKEERNVLRRIYDGLNVLEACGVVGKTDKMYYWKGYSKANSEAKDSLVLKVNEMKTSVETKRKVLRECCEKYYSVKELISRNKNSRFCDEKIEFPFIVVGTEEHYLNKMRIESNKSVSNVSVKFQREIRLFGDTEILIQLGFHKRSMHSIDIPLELFGILACRAVNKIF